MKKVSVIIPTFNESKNITTLIKKLLELKMQSLYEIIIVDDNSPDGTGFIVKNTFAHNARIMCIIRRNKPDLGKSIRMGILRAKGDVIVGMDGDFNHDVSILPTLVNALRNADLVVASRFVRGGGMQKKTRYWTSFAFNWMLKIFFRFPIIDNTSGYYAISSAKLHSLNIDSIYYGYGEYCLRLLFYAKQMKFRIKKVPVYYAARTHGTSKSRFFRMAYTYLKTAILLNLTERTKVQ